MENLDDSSVLPPVQNDLEWTYEAQQNLYDLARWARYYGNSTVASIIILFFILLFSLKGGIQITNVLTFLILCSSMYSVTQLLEFAKEVTYAMDNESDIAMGNALKKMTMFWIISLVAMFIQIISAILLFIPYFSSPRYL